jgi:hypothetical protein
VEGAGGAVVVPPCGGRRLDAHGWLARSVALARRSGAYY